MPNPRTQPIQMPLPFTDGTIDPITQKPARMPQDASNYPERELALSFKASWFGWFGALLMGMYDPLVIPANYTFKSLSVVSSSGRYGWYLAVQDADGRTLEASHWEANRGKAVRSLRYILRGGEAEWKVRAR